jgi:hypothetical protein
VNNKDQKAYELRLSGLTFKAISKKLGYADPSGAYQAYQRAREVISIDNLHEWRLLELERLDAIQNVLWEKVLEGSLSSISAILKVFDLRARLIGLYQPDKIQMGLSVNKESDQLIDEAVKEMGQILDYGVKYAMENNIDEPWVARMKQKRSLN